MPPVFRASAPRAISDVIAEAGMFKVVFCDSDPVYADPGDAAPAAYYASAMPALRLVIGEALKTVGLLMDRQKRSLLDLQVYEYSRYFIKVYGRPDSAMSYMPFIGAYQLGDIGKYLLAADLNFDEVLDDPMLLTGCVQLCAPPPPLFTAPAPSR